MGFISTVKEALEASTSTPGSKSAGDGSTGAFWCSDCGVRVPDAEVGEFEGDAPDCPECGDPMTYERSPGSAGCAC